MYFHHNNAVQNNYSPEERSKVPGHKIQNLDMPQPIRSGRKLCTNLLPKGKLNPKERIFGDNDNK